MIITTSPPYTFWKNSSILQHQNFDCVYIHIYVYIYNWVYIQVHLLYTIVLEWHIGSHACTFCIDSTESRSSTYVYYIVSFCYFKKNYTCSNLLGMKNDLHNFARYGNRLSTESSRFLQFVLVIDTFTTKWKCVLQDRHVASLLKVRVGQPPPQKNLDRQKKFN